jgi:hypothetical protein
MIWDQTSFGPLISLWTSNQVSAFPSVSGASFSGISLNRSTLYAAGSKGFIYAFDLRRLTWNLPRAKY